MTAGKHEWYLNSAGEPDDDFWDDDNHYGVACMLCGYRYCVPCVEYGWTEVDESCEEAVPLEQETLF